MLPLQLQAAYSSAKSGLINLTQSMGLELGKQGILCNAIAPGTIATAGTAGLWVRPNSPPPPVCAQRFDAATLVAQGEMKAEGGKMEFQTDKAGEAGEESFAGRTDSQRHMDMIALGRPGVPDDIAQGILFLCASNYTNGHTLVIDGAWSVCIRPF